MPSECPLCGAKNNIEFSEPAQDAPCPNCGHLLWASARLVHSITQRYADVLGTSPGVITANTRFSDLGADSLEVVEMVMELEEEYDIQISDDVAERIETVRDAVKYIQDQRRGMDG
ncbi:acyl carrier protein [bacterium]|nr:acyl carrier protein [bacterium]